jgi:hypothetical protein
MGLKPEDFVGSSACCIKKNRVAAGAARDSGEQGQCQQNSCFHEFSMTKNEEIIEDKDT